MSDLVTYQRDGNVGYLTLNRPDKLNAINSALISDLHAALRQFENDPACRVGILRGEGRAFCVGVDLSPDEHDPNINAADDRAEIEAMGRSWLQLWDCPKPIIAQVHGFCFAGGTQLPLCCDVIAIAEDTLLGWPRMPVGAGWISPMWSFHVGVQRAKLMSYRVGSTMTGRQAFDAGYASLLFPAESLAEETFRVAQDMAKAPSDLLRIKKLANNRPLERQGFREAVLAGAEWDAVAHTTDGVKQAREWIASHGLKGAIERFAKEGM